MNGEWKWLSRGLSTRPLLILHLLIWLLKRLSETVCILSAFQAVRKSMKEFRLNVPPKRLKNTIMRIVKKQNQSPQLAQSDKHGNSSLSNTIYELSWNLNIYVMLIGCMFVNIIPRIVLKETNHPTIKSKKHPTHKFRVSTIEPKPNEGNLQYCFRR